MSITVNCSIELTEEELFLILQLRMRTPSGASAVAMFGPILAAASTETPAMSTEKPVASTETPAPEPEVIPEERIEAVETVIAAALPPKPARSRAKTNGAAAVAQESGGTSGVNALAGQQAMQGVNSTPLAPPPPPPPPEPLEEAAMRSLLSKVGAVHPLKVKAITDLLEAHGGARRLSECDPSTWPSIAEAANATLVEYGA